MDSLIMSGPGAAILNILIVWYLVGFGIQLLRLIDYNIEYLPARNDGDLTFIPGSGVCLYDKSLVQVINHIIQ